MIDYLRFWKKNINYNKTFIIIIKLINYKAIFIITIVNK